MPRIVVDSEIGDERWRAAVEAAFAGCSVPRECLYTTKVELNPFLDGVTATLYTAGGIDGAEILVRGETPFGETPEELFRSLRDRFALGEIEDE